MFDSGVGVVGRLRPVVGELGVDGLDPEVAADLVGLAVEIEQLGAALRVLATRAVGRGQRWRREGFRSAAAWMAAQAGTAVGPAIATLETAGLLAGPPGGAAASRGVGRSGGRAPEMGGGGA